MVQIRQTAVSRNLSSRVLVLLAAFAAFFATMSWSSATAATATTRAASVSAPDWELGFKPGDLRLYLDPVDGRRYWYFTYTVTNLTERDRVFAPSIELFMDNGKILRSGRGVPSRTVEQLQKLLANPLLEDQNRIIGDLRVGKENARTGIAVWPAENHLDVTELTLFFRGLSSDYIDVKHPQTDADIRLYKTLRRVYGTPGDPERFFIKPLILDSRQNGGSDDCVSEFRDKGKSAGCWIYR
jgi:hypothetical protein